MQNKVNIFTSIDKSTNKAIYDGKKVFIITVFSDLDIAIVEDEDGNIYDVKNSTIQRETL